MLSRFLAVFAIGIVACLVVVGLLVGSWTLAIVGILVAAAGVLVWSLLFGSWRGRLSDPDPTDEDVERAKTMQFYTRNTRIPPQ